MDLWGKYKTQLLSRLRTDETFYEGSYGKPTSLPLLFKNSETLIKRYLQGLRYSDLINYQQGGARSTSEIWAIYSDKLVKKLSKDKSFKGPMDSIPVEFTRMPTYTEWIVKSYVYDGITEFKNFALVYDLLDKFIVLKDKNILRPTERDINLYCGITGCNFKFKKVSGLRDLIETYKDKLAIKKKIQAFYDGEQVAI
jgi:hypothetical protein